MSARCINVMKQYKQYIFCMHWILATVRQNVQNSEYKIQNIVSHNAMHMTWPSIWINQKWYNLNPHGVFCSSWPGEDCIFPENVVGLNLDHWLAHTCIKVFKSNFPPQFDTLAVFPVRNYQSTKYKIIACTFPVMLFYYQILDSIIFSTCFL